MIRSLKAAVPWWGKIGAKLVLSRLPMRYGFWQDVGLFRHGRMDSGHYALGVFDKHVQRADMTARLAGSTVLELGPGDGVATALIAYAHGARSILVDAGNFASGDVIAYLTLCTRLAELGLQPPDIGRAKTLQEVLEACEAKYFDILAGRAGAHS